MHRFKLCPRRIGGHRIAYYLVPVIDLAVQMRAMGAGYVQNLLLGAGKLPANRFQFDVGLSAFAFVDDDRPPRADCGCQAYVGWADQARSQRSVSPPPLEERPIKQVIEPSGVWP